MEKADSIPSWNDQIPETAAAQESLDSIDTALWALPIATRAFVLRLVLLNCVQRQDFAAVSHIIEKTKLHPGKFFVDLFDIGPIIGGHIYLAKLNIVGYSGKFYQASHAAGHKRLIRLIRDAQSLYHAYYFGRLYFFGHGEVAKNHPDFKAQEEAFRKMVEAHHQSIGIIKVAPVTIQQSCHDLEGELIFKKVQENISAHGGQISRTDFEGMSRQELNVLRGWLGRKCDQHNKKVSEAWEAVIRARQWYLGYKALELTKDTTQ